MKALLFYSYHYEISKSIINCRANIYPNEFCSLDISVFISPIKYLGEALIRGNICLQFQLYLLFYYSYYIFSSLLGFHLSLEYYFLFLKVIKISSNDNHFQLTSNFSYVIIFLGCWDVISNLEIIIPRRKYFG